MPRMTSACNITWVAASNTRLETTARRLTGVASRRSKIPLSMSRRSPMPL